MALQLPSWTCGLERGAGGRRQGERVKGRKRGNGRWLEQRKARGSLLVLGPQGPSPVLLLSPPSWRKVMEERQGSKSQQQEKEQQLFPSPISILHYQARKRGGERDGVGRKGKRLPPVLLGLKQ